MRALMSVSSLSGTSGASACGRGPSAAGSIAQVTSASSKEGASAASSPHGASTNEAPGKTWVS